MRFEVVMPLFATALAFGTSLLAPQIRAEPAPAVPLTAQVAIHVEDDDPDRMNTALRDAENIEEFYAARDEAVKIEFVTSGPGLAMLRADISPVSARIARMRADHDNLTFTACASSVRIAEGRLGRAITLLPDTVVVPSGLVRLIELRREGYSYLRA